MLDNALSDRAAFASRTVTWARENDAGTIVWYFHALDSIRHLDGDPHLDAIASALHRNRRAHVDGVEIVVQTERMSPRPGNFRAPLAAWWVDDFQLLHLDTAHRPLLDALISETHRAPIWLTAFDIESPEPIGVRDPNTGFAGQQTRVIPIVVSDELQAMTRSRAGMMNLVNGVHDSLADQFLHEARLMIRSGEATPEAVVVAALRVGWWPEKAPALLKKLT